MLIELFSTHSLTIPCFFELELYPFNTNHSMLSQQYYHRHRGIR